MKDRQPSKTSPNTSISQSPNLQSPVSSLQFSHPQPPTPNPQSPNLQSPISNPQSPTPNPQPPTPNLQSPNLLISNLPILLVLLLAFALRLHYLTLFQYHIDEFFTLAAANFIAESGLPRYPTGLFYDPGLPYSYLSGALLWLFGFDEALGRWPAVLFGTLAVATVYWLGVTILRSKWVGLLAALWLAVSLESVEWSGRARMITLAQWLGLLTVGLLWLGLTRASVKHRLAFALSYGLTLLSHFSTVVLMPAWFAAGLGLWWLKVIRWHKSLLRDIIFLLIVFTLAMSSGVIFQPPPSVEFQTNNQGLDAKVGALSNKFLQIPSDIGHGWETYGLYFIELPHGPLLLLTIVGLAITLNRLRQRSRPPLETSGDSTPSQPPLARGRGQNYPPSPPTAGEQHSNSPLWGVRGATQTSSLPAFAPRDVGAFFLGLIFVIVLAVLVLAIAPHWQRSRYLLMQLQGVFLLLGAHGCREIVALIPWPSHRKQLWQAASATILALLLTLLFWPPLSYIFESGSSGWNRYDQALGHIQENLADGDKVMSMHPPTSLLYLDQSDYYLVQSSPKLIVRPDGELGDRYSGAIWLDTAESFSQVLADENRMWLVTQEFWLFNSYDGYLQQQILWQMDKLWGEGGVWALASRPGVPPLAEEVEVILNAEFDGGAHLLGYTTASDRLAPGSTVDLTFFWQGNIPFGAKVLVHLRDEANNTVAQADHFIYDNKVPSSRWGDLIENDIAIRDGARLTLPPDLPPGRYRLLVGFYHPETFARLGVIDDQSGESAVIVGEWVVSRP